MLDLSPSEAAKRLGEQRDRMESRGLDYFEKVRGLFRDQAASFPATHRVIDAMQPIDAMQDMIRETTSKLLEG